MPTLKFSNKHFNPVNVFWHKGGNEVLQAVLRQNESYQQASENGLTWSARDCADNRELTRVIVTRDLEVNIQDDGRRMLVSEYRPTTARKKNYAVSFDGENDRVTVAHSTSLDLDKTWTIEAWVLREQKGVEQSLVEKFDGVDGKGGYALRIGADNKVQGGYFDGIDFIFARSKTVIEINRWYHIAASLNAAGNDIAIYINGERDDLDLGINEDLTKSACSLQFDGESDYLSVPTIDVSETAYTMSLWFKCEEPGQGLFSVDSGIRGAAGHDRDVYLDAEGGVCVSNGSSATLCARIAVQLEQVGIDPSVYPTNYADGRWHNITYVNGDTTSGPGGLYVDGVLICWSPVGSILAESRPGINIGYSSEAAKPYFKGQIAEVSMWNIARSVTDIRRKWRQRLIGNETGLQGLWHLDDGYGAVYKDSTANARNAIIEDLATTTQLKSMTLNGSNYASVASGIDVANKSFSLCCWAKRSGSTAEYFAGQGSASSSGLAFGFNTEGQFEFLLQGAALKTTTSYKDTSWHHWACTYDAATRNQRVYCDGKLVAECTAAASFSGSGVFTLGKAPWGSNFRGQMGGISLWSTVRTENEINQERNGTVLGTEGGAIAVWSRALQYEDTDDHRLDGVFEITRNRRFALYSGTVNWVSELHPGALPDRAPRWNRSSPLRLVPATITTRPSSGPLVFGARPTGVNTPFRGKLDAVRIWRVTRTATEVVSKWNSALAGNEPGLAGYWRCDEGKDLTVSDSTANGNHGILGDLTNSLAVTRPAWYESSLLLMDGVRFDGVDDFIRLPGTNPDLSRGITFEAWICADADSTGCWRHIVTLSQDTTQSLFILHWGTYLALTNKRDGVHSELMTSSNAMPVGKWAHVAGTIDASGQGILYVNGIEVKRGPMNAPKSTPRGTSIIGASSVSGRYFKGSIDEVRIWKNVRTPEEIQTFMRRVIEPSDPDLVALYGFDEGGGTGVLDQSINELHGVLGAGIATRMPVWLRSWERDNTGLSFDGNDCVTVPHDALNNLTAGTIEVWVNFASVANGTILAKQRDGVTGGTNAAAHGVLSIGYACNALGQFEAGTAGKIYFHGRNGTTPAQSTKVLAPNVWYHIAVVFDATSAKIYIDGRLDNTLTGNFSILDDLSATYTSLGGWLGQGGGQYLKGILDEVRIWNCVRTQANIQECMHRRINGTTTGLVAYWPIEEGTGKLLRDMTDWQRHGTLGGGGTGIPTWQQGSPMQFDGHNFDGYGQYVEIPNAPAINLTTNFTISAWVKPERFNGRQTIASKSTSVDECQYAISLLGDSLQFDYENEGNNFSVNGGTLVEGWNHVAVTVETRLTQTATLTLDANGNPITTQLDVRTQVPSTVQVTNYMATVYATTPTTVDMAKITMYVNGLAVASTQAPMATDASDAPILISAWDGSRKKDFFSGFIDSLVIHNRALSQAELQAAMHTRPATGAANVVGQWRLTSGATEGATVSDFSGKNLNGTHKRQLPGDRVVPMVNPILPNAFKVAKPDAKIVLDRPIQLLQYGSAAPFASGWLLEIWFQPPTAPGMLFSNADGSVGFGYNGTKFGWFYGTKYASTYSDAHQIRCTTSSTTNWHRLRVSAQRNGFSYISIDLLGNEYNQGTEDLISGTTTMDFSIACFGNRPQGDMPFGTIGEIRLWTPGSTEEEMALTGFEPGLAGLWKLVDSADKYLTDLTPYRNPARFVGDCEACSGKGVPFTTTSTSSAVVDVDADGLQMPPPELFQGMAVRTMIDTISPISEWTIGGFFMFDALPTSKTCLIRLNGRNRVDIGIEPQTGNIYYEFLVYKDNGSSSSWTCEKPVKVTYALPLKRWCHIAIVVDLSYTRIFIDAVEVFKSPGGFTLDPGFSGAVHWNTFPGKISEQAFWIKALDGTALSQYATEYLTGSEPGLYRYLYDPVKYVCSGISGGWSKWRLETTGLTLRKPETCLYLDGIQSTVTLPSARELQIENRDFTIELQLALSARCMTGTYKLMDTIPVTTEPQIVVGVSDGRVYMSIGTAKLVGGTTLTPEQWTSLAFRYDSERQILCIFVNGTMDAELRNCAPLSGTQPFILGSSDPPNASYIANDWLLRVRGYVSDFAIWKCARTSDEIQAGTTRRYTGNEYGIAAYWRLDGTVQPLVVDSGARRLHGVIANARWFRRNGLVFEKDPATTQPSAARRAAAEYMAGLPVADTPENRARATNIVPSPTAATRAKSIASSSTDSTGALLYAPPGLSESEAAAFLTLMAPVSVTSTSPPPPPVDTSKLPEPFKSLATRIIAAVLDTTNSPLGEIKLSSTILGPFDYTQHLFATPTTLLHIKKAFLQFTGVGADPSPLGIRLGGEVSIANLPPVRIECDFYFKGLRPKFPQPGTSSTSSTTTTTTSSMGDTAFTIKFHLPEPVGVGAILPSVPIVGGLQLYKPSSSVVSDESKRLLALVITNDSDDEIGMIPGVNAFGTVRLSTSTDPVFKFIGDLLQITELQMHVGISPTLCQFDAVAPRDVEIIKGALWFKKSALSLAVETTPPAMSATVKNSLLVKFAQNELMLTGALQVKVSAGNVTLGGAFSMAGAWREPFGIRGLVVSDVAAEVAGSPRPPWLSKLGVTGNIAIGKMRSKGAVLADVDNPQNAVLIGDAEDVQIPDIINTLCGANMISGPAGDILSEFRLRRAKFSVVPQACSIGEFRFDEEGISVRGAVTIFGWNGDTYLRVHYTKGITAYATVDTINIAGGLISLTESQAQNAKTSLLHTCPPACSERRCISVTSGGCQEMVSGKKCSRMLVKKSGPQLYLRVGPEASEAFLSARVSILGIGMDTLVHFTKNGIEFRVEGNLWNLFKASLQVNADPRTSFVRVKGELQLDFKTRLREEVLSAIRAITSKAIAEVASAQAAVASAQSTVNGWLSTINQMRAVVREEREAINRRLTAAINRVNATKRKVRKLRDEIDDEYKWYNDLEWWEKVLRSVDHVARIVGLEIALGVAEAALWVAEQALTAIRWLVNVTPIDLDPRVAVPLLAYGAAMVVLTAAAKALEGVRYVVRKALYVVEKLASFALGEIFDVRAARFEQQFGGANNDARIRLALDFVFLRKTITLDVDVDLRSLTTTASSLATRLIDNYAG